MRNTPSFMVGIAILRIFNLSKHMQNLETDEFDTIMFIMELTLQQKLNSDTRLAKDYMQIYNEYQMLMK